MRLIRTDRPDAPTNEQASAQLRVTVKSPDPDAVGRRFSNMATEMALASYPGFYLTSPPGDATAYGVYLADARAAVTTVDEVVVHHDGRRVPSVPASTPPGGGGHARPPRRRGAGAIGGATGPTPDPQAPLPLGTRRRGPVGRQGGQRQRRTVGPRRRRPFVGCAPSSPWTRLRVLLPEAAALPIDRYELPNLRALNFVVHGLLGEGVASSTRPDAQAKSLGEYLRSRLVDIPEHVLDAGPRPPAGARGPE